MPRRRAGRPVNIKKGQFLSPQDMKNVVDKAREASGTDNILVCERGFSFGYSNLVSDMRSLAIMRNTGCPVVFDATHSVQLPGGQGTASGGQREFVPVLARAAVATGIAGLFMETHPDPEKALSDGPNAWPLPLMQGLLETLVELDRLVKKNGFAEDKVNEHELHRRRGRARDPRFARQPHGRGRRAARVGRDGPRRGALGRLDRRARGGRAARRRQGRYGGKGVLKAVENVNTEISRGDRRASTRPSRRSSTRR